MIKKMLVLTLAVLMVFNTIGCGKSTEEATETEAAKSTETAAVTQSAEPTEAAQPTQAAAAETQAKNYVIGFSALNLANTFFPPFVELLQARCDELGIELIVHDGKSDVNLQINAIENWIAQGVDAIICSPVDPTALQASVDMAMKAGIPFINTDSECERKSSYIGLTQYNYGYLAGKIAAEWCNENLSDKEVIKFAIFNKPQSIAVIERANGIVAGITENCPKAEIVAQQPATTADAGMAAAETILQAYPDIDAFVGVNDTGVLGAYEAIMASGMDTSKLCLVGLDATSDALAKISEGTMMRGTVNMGTQFFAKTAIDLAVQAIEEDPTLPERTELELIAITADNIAEYYTK